MRPTALLLCTLPLWTSLCFPARAGSDHPPETLPRNLAPEAVGLAATPEGLLGMARTYEARFAPAGVQFVAVAGEQAPEEQVLGLALTRLGRGALSVPIGQAAPLAEGGGNRVLYPRGPGIEEHFEVTAAGLEHSLVLASRPSGQGDLRLNFELSGNLAPYAKHQPDGSWLFDGPYADVGYGTLTAIDALGHRVTGRVSVFDSQLEWRIDGDFIDSAVYPLTLDPLVNTPTTLVGIGNNDVEPESAFDELNYRLLVVWRRTLSASSRVIRGQFTDINGVPQGPFLVISGGNALSRPRVATFNTLGKFVVTWLEDDAPNLVEQVRAAIIDGATGALQTTLAIDTFIPGFLAAPDVASELLGTGIDRCYVVWYRGGNGIYGSKITPNGAGFVASAPSVMVSAPSSSTSNGLISDVSLASNLGVGGQLGVGYLRRASIMTNNYDAYMAVFDRDLAVVAGQALVYASPLAELGIELDGSSLYSDGMTWTVAVASDKNGSAVHDLNTQVMRLQGGVLSSAPGTPITLITGLLNGLHNFSVSTRPGKSLVAYQNLGLLSFLNLVSLDSATNLVCDVAQAIELVSFDSRPAVSCLAATSGAYYNTTGVILWNNLSTTTGNQQDIRFQQIRLFNDSVPTWSNLGGGCGPGGNLDINQAGVASIGNGYFVPNIQGAIAFAPVCVLNIAAPQLVLPCGGCEFLPYEVTLVVPMFGGSSSVVLPIPCKASLVGKSVQMQYTVLAPGQGPCPSSPDIALSNRVLVTVGT